MKIYIFLLFMFSLFSLQSSNYFLSINKNHYRNAIKENLQNKQPNVPDVDYDSDNLGGLSIDEEGFISGTNAYFTLFDKNKTVSEGEKKYFELQYKKEATVNTTIGIGLSDSPNTQTSNWIGTGANGSFAYWGYTWTGDINSASAPIIDGGSNPVLGFGIDYTTTPVEINFYVNGEFKYLRYYTGERNPLYMGSSRYYGGIPPHKVISGSQIQYLPSGYNPF